MKRILAPIVILGGFIAIALYMVRTPTTVEEFAPEVIPVAVRVQEVELGSVQLTVESQGKVQAAQIANLSAPVAGPVAWISPTMEAGGYVTDGETLLRLETSDYETMLARSQATMQQTKAEADHAAREYDRMKELAEERLASQSQLQDAQRQAEVTNARLADAQANFNQAELDLQRAEIKAPFDAIIQSRDVELGQYVNRAQSVAVLYGAEAVSYTHLTLPTKA